jgi:hypothetical protein
VLRLAVNRRLIQIDDEAALQHQLDAALDTGFARVSTGEEPHLGDAGPATNELGEKVMRTAGRVVRWEGQVRILVMVGEIRTERGKMKEVTSGKRDVFVEEGMLAWGCNPIGVALISYGAPALMGDQLCNHTND